jgi:copper transport protein
VSGLVAAWLSDTAYAQESNHGSHPADATISSQDLAVGLAHGTAQGAAVFLAGLVAFIVLVWLPASQGKDDSEHEKVIILFGRWIWVLVGLLVVAGLAELPLYALRASGEALGFRLLREALFDTQVGQIWIERIAFGFLAAKAATYSLRLRRPLYWWGIGTSVVASALLLTTLTRQSHAAAEESLLPFAADWLHVTAASLWMGGLLGFPILLIGPLRAMPTEARKTLLARTVRRFSKVATGAIVLIIVTGLYTALLHVPNLPALIETPYGQVLILKLGILIFLLMLGAQNLMLQGKGPFGRLVGAELILALGIFAATGLLTTLPPADAAQQEIIQQIIPNPTEDIRQPAMPTPPPLRKTP